MQLTTRTAVIACAAAASQTLPEKAVAVLSAVILSGTTLPGIAAALTPVTGTPAAGQIQFTGTPEAPSETVTLNAAPTVGTPLFVTYVPVGAVQAAQ